MKEMESGWDRPLYEIEAVAGDDTNEQKECNMLLVYVLLMSIECCVVADRRKNSLLCCFVQVKYHSAHHCD
jgi:hypothetical protein